MPAPRIYSVVPHSSSGGQDYGPEITEINQKLSLLQQGLSNEVSARGQGDTTLGNSISSLGTTVSNLSNQVNGIRSYRPKIEVYTIQTLIETDLVIQLQEAPVTDSVEIEVITGPEMHQNFDFTYTGNTLTILASSDLAQALSVGDKLEISYSY